LSDHPWAWTVVKEETDSNRAVKVMKGLIIYKYQLIINN
jgi:hypothetical protein